MIELLFKKTYAHFSLVRTGIEYTKPVGRQRFPGNKIIGCKSNEVRIVRIIIEVEMPSKRLDIYHVASKMSELKAYADFDTIQHFTIGRNNFGNYLLEIPILPINIRVSERFLEWLDETMEAL